MQIKESVAKSYGVENIYNPQENIKAGTLHLKRLQNMYKKMGADSLNAILLTIAAYNCGEGRIIKNTATINLNIAQFHRVYLRIIR